MGDLTPREYMNFTLPRLRHPKGRQYKRSDTMIVFQPTYIEEIGGYRNTLGVTVADDYLRLESYQHYLEIIMILFQVWRCGNTN